MNLNTEENGREESSTRNMNKNMAIEPKQMKDKGVPHEVEGGCRPRSLAISI